MNKEDFYKLTIDQKIWYEGVEKEIYNLTKAHSPTLRFVGSDYVTFWSDICADCSLEAPVKKQKYFLWLFKNTLDVWQPSTKLYNDKFKDTTGHSYPYLRDTKNKKKIESIFIEV